MNAYFILALFQHGYKARVKTLYHLLKGKRSSSVLVYGFLFDILRFIDCYPTLTEKGYEQLISKLAEKQLITIVNEEEAKITPKGVLKLNELKLKAPIYPYIDNYRFGKKDQEIFRVFQFVIQVVSHLSYNSKQYVPIEHSPVYQGALKQWLSTFKKEQVVKQLKEEWFSVFEAFTESEADYFVQQFSGYQHFGKTVNQLIPSTFSNFEKDLLNKNHLHYLLKMIQQQSNLPLLQSIMSWPFFRQANQSVQETQRYLALSTNIDEIAEKRQLKNSTIKDHLIELSLFEKFPFTAFLAEETINQLSKLNLGPYQEWSYQSVRKLLPNLDYFDFRLYQIKSIRKERQL